MPSFGYKLSSEEHGPNDLVRQAQRAEEAGFEFAAISDHFHPWVDAQGSLAPSGNIIESFQSQGGAGKPAYAEVAACYGEDEDEARKLAFRQWPITGLAGQLNQELATPAMFEQAVSMTNVKDATSTVACGPDPDVHLEQISKFVEAGYSHIWIHQIGPDQDAFFDFYRDEVLPKLR